VKPKGFKKAIRLKGAYYGREFSVERVSEEIRREQEERVRANQEDRAREYKRINELLEKVIKDRAKFSRERFKQNKKVVEINNDKAMDKVNAIGFSDISRDDVGSMVHSNIYKSSISNNSQKQRDDSRARQVSKQLNVITTDKRIERELEVTTKDIYTRIERDNESLRQKYEQSNENHRDAKPAIERIQRGVERGKSKLRSSGDREIRESNRRIALEIKRFRGVKQAFDRVHRQYINKVVNIVRDILYERQIRRQIKRDRDIGRGGPGF